MPHACPNANQTLADAPFCRGCSGHPRSGDTKAPSLRRVTLSTTDHKKGPERRGGVWGYGWLLETVSWKGFASSQIIKMNMAMVIIMIAVILNKSTPAHWLADGGCESCDWFSSRHQLCTKKEKWL